MYAAQIGGPPVALNEASGSALAAAVAMLAGWLAERAFDTGLRMPGIGPVSGLVGLYAGRWLWSVTGWDTGPTVAGLPLIPAVAGAFAVCGVLKLVALGFAGPRW